MAFAPCACFSLVSGELVGADRGSDFVFYND